MSITEEKYRYFFVIGAQKAGTTALFRYLRKHPEIYMPPEKEIPYFSEKIRNNMNWREYRKKYLVTSEAGKVVVGTASPQYLADKAVAKRIADTVPEAKIICLVRDPIERAVSHYKMSRRRGIEERTISQVVTEQLDESKLDEMRNISYENLGNEGGKECCVVWGEYARLLQPYFENFPRENVLILFSDELKNKRADTLHGVLEFLGVESSWLPDNLQSEYHKGGTRPRFALLDMLSRMKLIRLVLKLLLSERMRDQLRILYLTLSASEDEIEIPDEVYERLRQHYHADLAYVETLTGKKTFWFKHERKKSANGKSVYQI